MTKANTKDSTRDTGTTARRKRAAESRQSAKDPSVGNARPTLPKRTAKRKPAQVYHIFRFEQRYELPEDMRMCRKSGLQYSRDFVGISAGDEAAGYHKQFGLLCNGDGFESLMMFGLYRRLVNMAAEHSRAKRGYLLAADDQPLTDSQIAKLVNLPATNMRKLLKRFVRVKLIERVDLPEFDLSKNEIPDRRKTSDIGGSDTTNPPGRGRKGAKNDSARNTPGNPGKKQAPLKKRQKGKRVNKENCPNGQKAPNGTTAKGEQEETKRLAVGQGDAQETAPDVEQAQLQAEPRNPPDQAQVQEAPQDAEQGQLQAEPFEPHFSEALGGGGRVIPLPIPPGARLNPTPSDLRATRPTLAIATTASISSTA